MNWSGALLVEVETGWTLELLVLVVPALNSGATVALPSQTLSQSSQFQAVGGA